MISTIGEGTRLGGGRYVLQERLGSGGAATVWLGDDTLLERPVAVKVLAEALASDENWLARFKREARLAAGLSNPNLVSVYDYDAGGERPYIVMAYLPGGSLWDRMQAGERSDPLPLATDILTALEAIHSAGIIHRDIKPGNVLFAADGTACLTDFGVARPEDATSLTQTGQIPGTANFMAPELWEGEPADERSDLYAAGVLLRDAIGNDAAPSLVELVDRMLATEPGERPQSAREALDSLRADGSLSLTPPALSGEPTPRTIIIRPENRSHRGPAIAGVALLAVVAAIAIAQAVGAGGDSEGGDPAGGSAADGKAPNTSETQSTTGDGNGSEAQAGSGTETVDPVALDQEGKALLDAGNPEEAIPLLQQAVDYYPEDSRDLNYAYALYNLGHALLLSGRPDEAIPYLKKRLTFDDQTPTVQATLDEAYAAAGAPSDTTTGTGTPQNGKVPPGQAKKDD